MATDKEPTFLLQPWSVQRRNRGWYVSRSTSRFDKTRTEWRGPYRSATSATLTIARELRKVIERRDRRYEGT